MAKLQTETVELDADLARRGLRAEDREETPASAVALDTENHEGAPIPQ
jgi:hypothetical protein